MAGELMMVALEREGNRGCRVLARPCHTGNKHIRNLKSNKQIKLIISRFTPIQISHPLPYALLTLITTSFLPTAVVVPPNDRAPNTQ